MHKDIYIYIFFFKYNLKYYNMYIYTGCLLITILEKINLKPKIKKKKKNHVNVSCLQFIF